MRMLDQLTKKSQSNQQAPKISIKKNSLQFRAFIEMQQDMSVNKPIKKSGHNTTAYLFESDHSSQLSGTQERSEMGRHKINEKHFQEIKQTDKKIDIPNNKDISQTVNIDIPNDKDISKTVNIDIPNDKDISQQPNNSKPCPGSQIVQPTERTPIKLVINDRNELQIQSNKSVAQILGPYSRNNTLKIFQNSTDRTNRNQIDHKKGQAVPFRYEPTRNIWTVGLQFYAPATAFLRKYFRFENVPRDTVRILIRNMKQKEGPDDVVGEMERGYATTTSKMKDRSMGPENVEKNELVEPWDSAHHSGSNVLKPSNNTKAHPFVADHHLMNISKYLLPHQREAVNLAIHKSGRVILADEMGLGKTVTALAISAYYKQDWPLLIISPSGLMENWKNEIDRFLNYTNRHEQSDEQRNVLDVAAIRSIKDIANQDILIVSYDFLWRNIEYFKGYVQENGPCRGDSKKIKNKHTSCSRPEECPTLDTGLFESEQHNAL